VLIVPASRVMYSDHESRPSALLVDRQPLFLAALKGLLQAPPLGAEVTVATHSGAALELIEQRPFDLVICELKSRPIAGIELAAHVVSRQPTTRVILLGEPEDEHLLVDALSSGVLGLFTKNTPYEEFLGGVQAVLEGHSVIGSRLQGTALARLTGRAQRDEPSPRQLSPAELHILNLVGRAQSVSSIADARGISQKTVRNHLASIYRKLEVRSRTEAVLYAARMGLNADATDGRE
jgi:DNA-binding NarL/FixJ family response regulator